MFPCSSIYQHVPMTNNQPPKPNNNSTAFQIVDYHDDHDIHDDDDHHYSSLPSILEGVMLSQHSHHDLISSSSSQEQHNNKPPKGSSSSSKKQISTARAKNKRNKAENSNNKKKDRHSKIYTAHGLRDRRMRLSLQIARKFFDLQDMLGFDKASRTIDWLFNKSKTAIKELKESIIDNNNNNNSVDSSSEFGEMACRNGTSNVVAEKDKASQIGGRRAVVARESRDKARARARARTRDKLLKKSSGGNDMNNNHYYNNSDLKMVDQDVMIPLFEIDYCSMSQQGQSLGFPHNQNSSSVLSSPFANFIPNNSSHEYCFDYSIQEEQKPSDIVSNYSESNSHHNPSVFMPQNYSRSVLRVQNPNDSSFLASLDSIAQISDQEENPTSDFLSNSNIFRNLNF